MPCDVGVMPATRALPLGVVAGLVDDRAASRMEGPMDVSRLHRLHDGDSRPPRCQPQGGLDASLSLAMKGFD